MRLGSNAENAFSNQDGEESKGKTKTTNKTVNKSTVSYSEKQRPATALPPRVPRGEIKKHVMTAAAALGHPI